MPPPDTGAFCCGYNDPSVRQHMAQLQCKRPYSGTEHVDGPENFSQPEPQILSMSIDSPLSILPLLPVPFIDLPPSSFPSLVTSPFLRRRPDRRPRGDEQQRGVGLHGAADRDDEWSLGGGLFYARLLAPQLSASQLLLF